MAQITFGLAAEPVISTTTKFTESGVDKLKFTVNLVIKCNQITYANFTNPRNQIEVVCVKGDSGTSMDAAILAAVESFITANYPPITV